MSADVFPASVVEFALEVAKGTVPGTTAFGITSFDDAVSQTESTICNIGTRYTWQTSAQSMEVVSNNANDTALGTGARTLTATFLTSAYVEATETVSLNGTTPVAFSSQYLRTNGGRVVTAGSGEENAGRITIRVASGGVDQNVIRPGANRSLDGIHTVEAGKTAFLASADFATDKGNDVVIRVYRRPFGGLFLIRSAVPLYQGSFGKEFTIYVPVSEKTDIEFTAQSDNAVSSAFAVQQFLLVDNAEIPVEVFELMLRGF